MMDKSSFDKLSDSNKLGALFDLLARLSDRQSAMDKNIVDGQSAMDKKVDTMSKEIKHAFKQVSDRVDEVVKKVASLEHGLKEVKEKTDGLEVEAREVKAISFQEILISYLIS